MLKQYRVRLILSIFILIPLLFSGLKATPKPDPNATKLSEYNVLDAIAEMASGLSSSSTIFNGQPYIVKLTQNRSDGFSLVSTYFANNYSTLKTSEFKLTGLLTHDGDYNLTLSSNAEHLFLLISSKDSDYRSHKNLLLQSSDGITWKIFKSFPAEWSLNDLDVHDDNLSLTCFNCEDEDKPAYIISTNKGVTWHKYALPETTDGTKFSGVAYNKLFAVTTARDPHDRARTVSALYANDLNNKHSEWIKTDITSVLEIPGVYQEHKINYQFTAINHIFNVSDYLIAVANYSAELDHTTEKYTSKYFAWLSKDHGLTWNLINIDLNDEVVLQITKNGKYYNFVTAKNKPLTIEENDDGEVNKAQLFKDVMAFFDAQKYSFYQLTQEQLTSTDPVALKPKFEFNHALGFNFDYKDDNLGAYVDTLLIHNTGKNLMMEFYRLHI